MQKTIQTKNANTIIRTYYDGQQAFYSDATALNFIDPLTGEVEISLTKQADAPGCDINNIMARYEKNGVLDHVNRYQGQYADLGDAHTYHDAMNAVVDAQAAFNSLPADIRTRFGNDPGAFLDFVGDESNLPEMAKMGLVTLREPEATPPKVEAPKPTTKAKKSKDEPSDFDTGNIV